MIRVSLFALTAAIAAASLVAPASAKPSHIPAHRSGPLYDVVPQGPGVVYGTPNSDDPSLTGGGSAGYNEMIYNS
jgi:hypothetical protein